MAWSINSAYTERMRASFSSTNGRIFHVQIYDRQWTGAYMAAFSVVDGGLVFQYDTDGEEKFAPIMGSKCKLTMMMDFDNNLLQSFWEDIIGLGSNTYVEGDVMIVVKAHSVYGDVLFCGEYLQDLDTLPDVSTPFPIELTFTDGIGKLKEITFESKHIDSSANTYAQMGHQYFTYWIGQIMQHTKFYKNTENPNGFWDDATSQPAFRTCVRWYNSLHHYAPSSTNINGDPLNMTKGSVEWADEYNPANSQRNIASAYEVLKQICRAWGMRVVCWMGEWVFTQIFELNAENSQTGTDANKWNNPVDIPSYLYFADGDVYYRLETIGIEDWGRFNNRFHNITSPAEKIQKLAGGKYKFLPVLNEAKVNLVHEGFQNLFGGFDIPTVTSAYATAFMGNGLYWGTQFKYRCNFVVEFSPPINSQANSVLASGYHVAEYNVHIVATEGPAFVVNSTTALATLDFDPVTNTYSWDTTPTYVGSDLGPHITFYNFGDPFPAGQPSNIPLFPIIEFEGFRDDFTNYFLIVRKTFSGNYQGPILQTAGGTQIDSLTGYPYYGNLAAWGMQDPVTMPVSPPSWSNAIQNDYVSTIQPISTSNTPPTQNTIFINSQTNDSQKLDWGDIYYGDGPEVWDNSSLQVRTGAGAYIYSNPNSPDWQRCGASASLPPTGSGYTFNQLLCASIKQSQQKVIKRASFKSAISEDNEQYGQPYFMNPIGVIKDIQQDAYGANLGIKYFLRSGKLDLTKNQWDGEFIETTTGSLDAGSQQYKIAGGTNLKGSGNTMAGHFQNMALHTASSPRITLGTATEAVTGGVALTSLTIQTGFGTDIQAATDLPIGTAFNLKENDLLYMVYQNGRTYSLTLTADVTSLSTRINFDSITPDADSMTYPIFQIPMFHLYENTFRKISGKIAGFDISATSISKGGIGIDGFLDSDTMSGASATTLPTSESVKAYVDSSGGGLTNYARFTCTGTGLSSATDGEGNAVVVPFDTEVGVTGNTIEAYGASGVTGISDSEYCFGFGGDPASGYFELLWNITSDTSVTNNRVLAGVKLQEGVDAGGTMAWTDVSGTHAYIYNRGNGNVREGSCSGGALQRLAVDSAIYHRIVIWKEAASVATTKVITVTNGCQIIIKQLNE